MRPTRAGAPEHAAIRLLRATVPTAVDPLVYGLVPNAPPSSYVDVEGRPTGLFIELFPRLMDELGVT